MVLDRKPLRRMLGLVPAMMFACGAVFAISEALEMGVPRTEMFKACLVTELLLGILFYNKKTALATAALAAVAAAYAIFRREEIFAALRPTVEAAAAYIATGSGSDEIRLLVGRLLACAVAGIAVFTAGRLRGAWLLGLGTLGVFVAAWFMGMREVFGCLALCASATAAVSASGFARKVREAAERGSEPARKKDRRKRAAGVVPAEKKDAASARKKRGRESAAGAERRPAAVIGSPAAIALFAIPLAAVLAVAGTLFRPVELSESLKIARVEEAVGDAVDTLASGFDGYTRRTSTFSLNAVGYGLAAELGGPVDPSDETTLLVATRSPIQRLRGSVRASYTGKGWEEGELEGAYRFASNLWRDEKADAFDLLRGNVPGRESRFNRAFQSMSYTVYHYSHYTSMFTVERPERVTATGLVPYFNLQGELYPKERMNEGDGYEVTGFGETALTRTSASALSALVEYAEPEDEAAMRTVFEEYLPDGQVTLPAGTGEDGGDADIVRTALDEAEVVSAYGAVDYHIFYGYTEEQTSRLMENEARITQMTDRLFERYDPQSEEELLEMLRGLQKFEKTLPKVEPEAFLLRDDELAALGFDGDEFRYALEIMIMGEENQFRQDSETRKFLRKTMYVTSTEAPEDISDFRYIGSEIPPEEERSPVAIYMKTGAWQWWSRSTGGMPPNSVLYVRYRPFPLDGRDGTYYGGYLPETSARLADLMDALGCARLEYGGMQRYMPNIAQNFRDIVLEKFAARTDEGAELNKFDLALELARELEAGTRYTLSPVEVPEGVDFVNWFLSAREGYCTYYATAMAVLARGYGIPSRYAEGYSLSGAELNENGFYELTGMNAHAWPELFFEGVGWVTVDPLALGLLDLDYEPEDKPPVEVTQPSAPPAETSSEPDADEDDARPGDGEPIVPAALVTAAIAVGCVLLLLALFLAARALALRGRSLAALRKQYGDRAAAMELWLEAVRLLGAVEPLCRRADGETADEFARRVKRIIYVDGASPEGAARTAEKAWYSSEPLREDELAELERYVKGLRRMMFRKRPFGLSWVKRRYLKRESESR